MRYQDFIEYVQELSPFKDQKKAESAVSDVLGKLVSRLDEDVADQMTRELPEPLKLESLEPKRKERLDFAAEDVLKTFAKRFSLQATDARIAVSRILGKLKQTLEPTTLATVVDDLPGDWKELVMCA